jgi:hypothetical protein
MDALGIIVGILGIVVALYFGVRSMFQSSDMEALQTALRANSQAVYNHMGRMGASAQELKSAADLQKARELRQASTRCRRPPRTPLSLSAENTHTSRPTVNPHGNPNRLPQAHGPRRFGGVCFS